MSEFKRLPRCYNCGAILQKDNPSEIGYVPEMIEIGEESLKDHVVYCQSCFESLKEINTGELNQNVDEQILKILDDAIASDALIVWVIDLFSFTGIIKKSVAKKVKNSRVAVLGTKKDYFKSNINEDVLKEFILNSFKEAGIKPVYLKLLDTRDEKSIEEVFKKGLKERRGHDVYMIGDLNSGKSSLMKQMLRYYENNTRKFVKVREYPNTDTDVLEIPLTNSTSIYDLPGFALDLSVIGKVEKSTQRVIIPKEQVKITTISLKPRESLSYGTLSVISLTDGKNTSFKCYSAEQVQIRKFATSRLTKNLDLFFSSKEYKPYSTKYRSFKDFDVYECVIKNDDKRHNIAIEGLGWVSFIGKGQRIRVTVPRGTAIRESFSKVE